MDIVACRSCGGLKQRCVGPLPALPQTFGGQSLGQGLEAESMFCCEDCDLRYRHPCASQRMLTGLYETLPPTVWEAARPKPHWATVLKLMAATPNHAVLDVGCFNGDFLHWLPGEWRKLGIEPNRKACQ